MQTKKIKKSEWWWSGESLSFKPPEKISTEEWGKKNRELSILTSAKPGPWSMAQIPFFRPVLEALDDEDIETVVIQKATQIAGTESVLTWAGKVAHQDPGPMMIVFADEDTAKETCKKRIMPLFRSSSALSKLIIEAEFGQESIMLKNGFSLIMAWASSIARTASRPIRYLILDEITKPGFGKTQAEGSVINRILQRTETFPNKKIVMLSSVTVAGDNMDKEIGRCNAQYEWCVPCPYCGDLQPLRFTGKEIEIEGQKRKSGEVVYEKNSAGTARYKCASCFSPWTNAEKNNAVQKGTALSREKITGKIKSKGFHIPRTISLFPGGNLETLSANYIDAKDDILELQSFINNSLAEHWTHVVKDTTDLPIAARKCDIPRKVCPAGTLCLTAGFDMQKYSFWYSVWAHKYVDMALHSYMIWDGEIETFDQIRQIVYDETFEVQGGGLKRIWRAGLDTGGGVGTEEDGWSRTSEAYDFLRRAGHNTIFGTKGDSKARDTAVWFSIIDRMPGKVGAKIPGGITLYHLDTCKIKDLFFSRVIQGDDGAAPIHFHSKTSEEYFKQVLSEEKTRDRVTGKYGWVKKNQRDNHQLDTAVINQALINDGFRGGIRLYYRAIKHQEQQQTAQLAQEPEKKQTENPFTKGGNSGDNPYTRGR